VAGDQLAAVFQDLPLAVAVKVYVVAAPAPLGQMGASVAHSRIIICVLMEEWRIWPKTGLTWFAKRVVTFFVFMIVVV